MSIRKAGARVGVLIYQKGKGTVLAPGIKLATQGNRVIVGFFNEDGAPQMVKTLAEYAEPPSLPETVKAWTPIWEALEQVDRKDFRNESA